MATNPKTPRTSAKQTSPMQTKTAAKAAPQTLTLGATTAQTEPQADGTLTLRLRRVIKAPAERIYQCFIDPDAYAKWLPPHGFVGKVHKMDAKVGGSYRMSFQTISKSWTQSFGGTYKELVPNRRIVHTDEFEGDGPKAKMTVTIDLKPVAGGTEVLIEQRGIPAGPMAEGSPFGWSQSLDNLATMCEIELPF